MMELNQFKYINDVLKRYGMENCKPNSTSHETRLKYLKTNLLVQIKVKDG
jgi:hypothetical protein